MQKRIKHINNAFYDELGDAWYSDATHPIALLRAENAIRNPWILSKIKQTHGKHCDVLDMGCGAGFLSNALALEGHRVTGVDLSAKSLHVARQRDLTHSVNYVQKDAFSLDFPEKSFDVICAMDFLEHVENPQQIVREAANLLRPGGLFFFHTFNRNFLSWLIVIKGVEWLAPSTPKNMHLYSLFIKPHELTHWCQSAELRVTEIQGFNPRVASFAFWKSVASRKIAKDFTFQFTSSLKTGYIGAAVKGA